MNAEHRDIRAAGTENHPASQGQSGGKCLPPEAMFKQGRDLLRRWFDDVESQIREEARRAGIFNHPSITGDAREQIVRDALRNILPARIEVGKGRVIGGNSDPSKQIDIVLFDGRFPVLRMGTDALYPVEGVVATIEVKSELNESELRSAFENAFSVMRILPSFVKEDADAWLAQRESDGATPEQAVEQLLWHLAPRTYVFAFDGLRSLRAQAEALQTCLSTTMRGTLSRPFIPSVIVGGGAVTVARDDQWWVTVPEPENQRQIDQKGVAITFESAARFGILASHLLLHVEQRTLMLEPPGTIRRTVQSYLPFMEYINDCIGAHEFSVALWNERAPGSAPTEKPTT